MDTDVDYHDLELGPLLRQLRAEKSLREVRRLTGISNSYLSQIERGDRVPGPSLLRRLAALYNVDIQVLIERAGFLDNAGDEPPADEPLEVERAYRYVLADPRFRFCSRIEGSVPLEAKRFIVQMYDRFTGKRLLA